VPEHEFAVWAPKPALVRLDVDGALYPMTGCDDGWWRATVDVAADARYGFVLDDVPQIHAFCLEEDLRLRNYVESLDDVALNEPIKLGENFERFADDDFRVFLGSGLIGQTNWQEDGKSDDH
jgi:hypothetical protein